MRPLIDREELRERCASVPLFPLPGVVFLPNTMLPLHVFEPRYRALVEDVLEVDGVMAIPRLAPGWEENYEGEPGLVAVCGVGQVVRHQPLPDGRCNMILLGLGRLRIDSEDVSERGYRVGGGTLLEDTPIPGGEAALRRHVEALKLSAAQLLSVVPELSGALESLGGSEGGPLEYMDKLAHLVFRDPEERQAWLELDAVDARGDLLLATLVELRSGGGDWG
jgi:Lon protease-like protein